jgi:hypothetical protein
LVAAGDDVGDQMIDVATGAVTARPNPGSPRTVVVTPDARRLIVSDIFTFVLWDVTNWQRPVVAASIPNEHGLATVEAMALTANGTLLVSAGRDGKLTAGPCRGGEGGTNRHVGHRRSEPVPTESVRPCSSCGARSMASESSRTG